MTGTSQKKVGAEGSDIFPKDQPVTNRDSMQTQSFSKLHLLTPHTSHRLLLCSNYFRGSNMDKTTKDVKGEKHLLMFCSWCLQTYLV